MAATNGRAADFSNVPGKHISHIDPPDFWDELLGNERYIADPSITIMPNGDYIVSRSEFGTGSTASISGKTKVFRSTNRGVSWSLMSEPTDILRATLFVHNNELFMLGYKAEGDDIVIRKSSNNGATWTSNTVIKSGSYGGTPNTPVVHDGKIWIGQSGTRVLSAPITSDLLQASSWTHSNAASSSGQPFGDAWQGWSEAQIVASPQTGVVLMPKIRALPYTALIHVNESTGTVSFNASAQDAFVSLPGGEKKFGAQYDPVSGKFFALTNTVLPAHADHVWLHDEPELIRNTATVLSSPDLINWDVEKIFLYTRNIDNGDWGEAFQYFNFAIDGDDLAVVSRTAFDTTGNGLDDKPPRGHDSNLLTFHKIEDFRTMAPEHILKIENGDVVRYEANGGNDLAPLGRFALGTDFLGVPLTDPAGVSQDADSGDVYIREAGGDVLRFDAAGNFQGLAGPNGHTGATSVSVVQPTAGFRTWTNSVSGAWSNPTNWYYWGRPDTNREVATFGSAIGANKTITIDGAYKVKGLRFRSEHRYALVGAAGLTLESDSGHSILDVQQGDHNLYVDIKLDSNTDAIAAAGAVLRIRSELDLNGNSLHVRGAGGIFIHGEFVMNGGMLTIRDAAFSFRDGSDATLDGTLKFDPDPLVPVAIGNMYDLLGGVEYLYGETFISVILPELEPGLFWNLSKLYVNGTVSVIGDIPGDLNRDGFVGLDDLDIVLNNWNAGISPSTGTPSIPEPATSSLMMLGGAVVIRYRN